jgi:Xaa-Pro aminopeptidase
MPPPPNVITARLAAARNGLHQHGVDGVLLTSMVNLRYLFGVVASAGMAVLHGAGATLIADERYARHYEDAAAVLPDVAVRRVPVGESYEATATRLVSDLGIAALGIEAEHLTVARLSALHRLDGFSGRDIRETLGLVERQRMVKDAWELGRLREAGGRLSEVAACILPKVLPGCTERQVAWEVELALHAAGFERPAFDTIVASGPNAARPHHRPTDRVIGTAELVIVDFGGVLDGYAVDMTRTVATTGTPARQRAWRDAVADAQRAAIAAAAPGVLPSRIDAAARESLERAGLGERFVHSTGHGLGLEVHERPTIGPRGDHDGPVAQGMVFTVEPGVYIPDLGGVRIEDDLVVTATGVERLTSAPPPFEAHES